MNKVILTGNFTKDTELKFLPSGSAVLKGTLAVPRRFKKEGQAEADFIPIVMWGKLAENTANYCGEKGNKISVAGRIETRKYEKDGQTRFITEVIVEEADFITFKKKNNEVMALDSEGTFEEGEIPF